MQAGAGNLLLLGVLLFSAVIRPKPYWITTQSDDDDDGDDDHNSMLHNLSAETTIMEIIYRTVDTWYS